MTFVRATVVLDEVVAMRVRQAFGGNLSRGVNSLLARHFSESASDDGLFGRLRGKGLLKDLLEMRREEREGDEV